MDDFTLLKCGVIIKIITNKSINVLDQLKASSYEFQYSMNIHSMKKVLVDSKYECINTVYVHQNEQPNQPIEHVSQKNTKVALAYTFASGRCWEITDHYSNLNF